MLPDEANLAKAKRREEQVKKWRERESDNYENNNNKNKRVSTVTFPQTCIFLSACAAGDSDEILHYINNGANINTTNIDGLTALHQVYKKKKKLKIYCITFLLRLVLTIILTW
jgi:hypothetical protein